MAPSEQNKLLRDIAKDVAAIKEQLVGLRIRIATVSATVAVLVALTTGWLSNVLTSSESSKPCNQIHQVEKREAAAKGR